jgi:hypothetical protein
LFAFVLVCAGILALENSPDSPFRPKFKTPYINGRYIVPGLYCVVVFVLYRYFKADTWDNFFSMTPRADGSGRILSGWNLFTHKMPAIVFIAVATGVTVLSFVKRLSLIPVLGLLTCFYLMTQLGITNWIRFAIWLVAGLVIYFAYSRKQSRLNTQHE